MGGVSGRVKWVQTIEEENGIGWSEGTRWVGKERLRGGAGPVGDFGQPLYFPFRIFTVQSPCLQPISSQVSLLALLHK